MESRLKKLLRRRGMSMSELSRLTGIRYATLHSMANNVYGTVLKEHIIKIANVLEVRSLDELYDLNLDD